MKNTAVIHPQDLSFFSTLARCGSLSAAAREVGVTTAAVSKRLQQMEARAGAALVNRTTRRMSLTAEGELFLGHARRILAEIDELGQLLGSAKQVPKGLLRVSASLGYGRSHVAPVISRFAQKYPEVEVQLQLSVHPPPIAEDAWDVGIQFGTPPDARVIARRLASNRRLLCAAPSYLARAGTPKRPADLTRHNCIAIRQGDEGSRVWRLTRDAGKERTESVRVRGNLSTNDGGVAVAWALAGHGILMRAEWDLDGWLKSGELVQVLPQYHTPDADIHAVYSQRHQNSTRVRVFVDFIAAALQAEARATHAE
jgi:DNA-binding transcriptional LysR family regulator